MWIARDKNGNLNLFYYKPFRKEDSYWSDSINDIENCITVLDETVRKQFENLTWEDEPIEVSIIETFRLRSLQAIK